MAHSKTEKESLAAAAFPAIARLVVVHRAILTRLRTTRLVCSETHSADRGCQKRKQNFQIILHWTMLLPTIANASEKKVYVSAHPEFLD